MDVGRCKRVIDADWFGLRPIASRQVREDALLERLAIGQDGNATRRHRPSMAEQRLKRSRNDSARDELQELFGHPVEIVLRATWRAGAVPAFLAAASGSYLRSRLELRQSARRVASELDPLADLARSSRRSVSPAPDLPVLDAYLVERDRVREFVALVAQLGANLDEVELTCTGPWLAYNLHMRFGECRSDR